MLFSLLLCFFINSFLFGACCQLSVNEAVIDDYNKPLLSPIDTFIGNDNRVPANGGSYGESDTILLETSKPSTSDKTSIYLSSHQPGQVYSPELPTHVTDSITTFGTFNPNKKKVPGTKQPHQTKPTPSKYGVTDKYVLVQTLSHDKNPSSKPGNVYDNEINSIESIILMLNDTKTGPQYNTEIKPQTTFEYNNGIPTKFVGPSSSGNFYITTKVPSSSSIITSTKRPSLYNITYSSSHATSIYTPTSTPATLATVFQKVPILTHSTALGSTTKSPSTSYVYSTVIPKRPSPAGYNPNRISSTTTSTSALTSSTPSKKPTKFVTNTKKPVQKLTTRPISTSYVSGPTPARPSFSSTKKPVALSSYTTSNKPQSSEVPVINKIGSSTPAPTVIVLGPYGIGIIYLINYTFANDAINFHSCLFRFNGKPITNHTHYTKTNCEFCIVKH